MAGIRRTIAENGGAPGGKDPGGGMGTGTEARSPLARDANGRFRSKPEPEPFDPARPLPPTAVEGIDAGPPGEAAPVAVADAAPEAAEASAALPKTDPTDALATPEPAPEAEAKTGKSKGLQKRTKGSRVPTTGEKPAPLTSKGQGTKNFAGAKKFGSGTVPTVVVFPILEQWTDGYLSDQDWELEPEELARLPFRLSDVLTVFGNGGGDLLGLDLTHGVSASEDRALAWWHEEPLEPDIDQNFWGLMDAWICGQEEDVDLAR